MSKYLVSRGHHITPCNLLLLSLLNERVKGVRSEGSEARKDSVLLKFAILKFYWHSKYNKAPLVRYIDCDTPFSSGGAELWH